MTDRHRVPDPRMIAVNPPGTWSDPVRGGPAQLPAPPPPSTPGEVVRPFMVTGGRTTPTVDGLRIETLVSAVPAALSAPLRFEQQAVVRLCQHPCSIAEIAAALHVPIGVARVLVADLIVAGYLRSHRSDELSIATIERIRDLVRTL